MREHWGSEKGFTGGSVTALAQTPDGYLWIGTEKGLIRFDGFSFLNFPQATPTTLPIGPVQALASDEQGNLWILLQSTKILRYHEGKFELGREVAEFGITSLLKPQGLARCSFASPCFCPPHLPIREDLNCSAPPSEPPNPAPSATEVTHGRAFQPSPVAATGVVPPSLRRTQFRPVISMGETSDGKVWLGTSDKGLFYHESRPGGPVATGLVRRQDQLPAGIRKIRNCGSEPTRAFYAGTGPKSLR